MEPIPARILRRIALACPSAPKPTEREKRNRAYIVEAAQGMFAAYGTPRITMTNLAEGCGLSVSTVRRHVCDMHYLFRLVLVAHLDRLLAGISQIPDHYPDRRARCRAEYRRLTRDERGRITPMHRLFIEHRASLPQDQRDPVEDQRRMIGTILGGNEWDTVLDLLDGSASLDRIEGMLASRPLSASRRPQAPAPGQRYGGMNQRFHGPCAPPANGDPPPREKAA